MEQNIRQPAVAGLFYPDDPAELDTMLNGFLSNVNEISGPLPKAIIVPHAGYIYSGPVAASAYAHLLPLREKIRRVVLLGPSHRVYLNGLAASHASHFATPLGLIPIDHAAIELALKLPQVQYMDAAHRSEHSLEVHLPFLQKVLNNFSLVPFVVGEATPQQVAQVLELFWNSPDTMIVISSDLSHYHEYTQAQQRDRVTSDAIEAMAPERIEYDDACGRNPINGLLQLARQHHLHVTTLDLRNSGDTAGPRDRVVGYGAYMVH